MTSELVTLAISGEAAVTGPPASRPAEAEGMPGPPLSQSLTMWDLETNLASLADSVETVEPEQARQFLEDFRQALMAAKEKRDRVASFLAYCEAMAEMTSKEIARLQKCRDFFTMTVERVEGYVESSCATSGGTARGSGRSWMAIPATSP